MRLQSLLASTLAGLVALPLCSGASPAASPSSLLTAEELFQPGVLGQAGISPDGRHLGAIVSDEHDQQNLLLVDLVNSKVSGLRATSDFEIYAFRWVGDDRLLFNISKGKTYSWGLYTAPLDTVDRYYALNEFDVTQIVGVPRGRTHRAIVWIVKSASLHGQPGGLAEIDTSRQPNAFRHQSNDDAVVRYYAPPKTGAVFGWLADRDGELDLSIAWDAGRAHVHRFIPGKDAWQELDLDTRNVGIMGADPDRRFLWVVTHSATDGFQLRREDLDTGQLAEPVFSDVDYDPSGGKLYFSEGGKLAGISYTQRQRVTFWFDQRYASIQAVIDQHYPGTANVLIDRDRAEQKFLFLVTGPQQPGIYVLLDLQTKKLQRITEAAPWLAGRPLLPVQPVNFKTRDHVKLEGYLTLPAGASDQHPVPLVVLVHGGPWVRDTPEFNPEVQFLASRGYAVLQPNYRGSSGYAPAISRDARFDFRRMHEDVTDATRAMLRVPLIDPKRVAIMGASFGGYLALAGVTFDDGLYRCAVTQCGVFDWERLIKSKRNDGLPGQYEFLRDEIGDPERDRARLDELSPLAHADRIHVPVFIAHGLDDNIVDVVQSKKLAAALKKNGVAHETFFRGTEGHSFYNYKNRVDYYHRVEAFLAANLGGATLTPVK